MSETRRSAELEGGKDVLEAVQEDVAVLREVSERTGWFRIEYGILALLAALLIGYTAALFIFDWDLNSLRRWGYVGIFLLAMSGSATVVLPTPSNVAIFGSGAFLDPVLGLPAPIVVGLVAGLGDALGEFSGYALGFAGTEVIRHQKVYALFERWMTRNGTATIFLLSTFPNPFFDLVGTAAGASRMPARRFFLAALGGKIVKDTFLAYGGSFSFDLFSRVM